MPASSKARTALQPTAQPILYGAFAVLCTLLNLGTQRLAAAILGPTALPETAILLLGMAAGTAVGLLSKFVLDKLVVFRHRASSAAELAGGFALYALFGVLTTAIFWGTELAFTWIWKAEASRYAGGAVGLAAGYTVKFLLDRRFVFSRPSDPAAGDPRPR